MADDGHRITASSETLMAQAQWTTDEYMRKAVDDIDGIFGNGFARAHPELVGSFMLTCALDFHAGVIARAIEAVASEVEDAAYQLGNISTEIETMRENMPTGEPND